MSKDRVTELAEKRSSLLVQLEEVESELRQEVENFGRSTATVRLAPKKPRVARTPTAADGDADSQPQKKRTAKEVVLEILSQNREGMELKEIVAEFTRMIQSKQYESKATKITPVVSQAIHQLKAESLVLVNKSQDRRSLYSVSAA